MGVTPKKQLGQNFLHSPVVLSAIAHAAEPLLGKNTLEIGPGTGNLTAVLLERGAHVVAVEKDPDLVALLNERFAPEIKSGQLKLVSGDILSLNPLTYNLQPASYVLVGNIPYYITGEILRKFVGGPTQPEKAVLMVQREVAKRIVARDKKESVLSISVKAYGTPRYVKTVKGGLFRPQPKVDSAILAIENISRNFFRPPKGLTLSVDPLGDERVFFALVKRGFSQKRKQLKNTLGIPSEVIGSCDIEPTARAEDLTLFQWKCLSNTFL